MTTAFCSLGDDDIRSGLARLFGVVEGRHHVHHLEPSVVRLPKDRLQVLVRARPCRRKQRRVCREHALQQVLIAEEQEVDAKRIRRDLASALDHFGDLVGIEEGSADHAEAAGFADSARQITVRVSGSHSRRAHPVVHSHKPGESGFDHLVPPVARKKVYQRQGAGSYLPYWRGRRQSYSKTGGECGIRPRGGGFADLCLTTWLTRHRPSQSHSLVGGSAPARSAISLFVSKLPCRCRARGTY